MVKEKIRFKNLSGWLKTLVVWGFLAFALNVFNLIVGIIREFMIQWSKV